MIIRAADQRVVPWKNGLGTTREVGVDPPDGDVARGFRWRVSLATIERDCPFSAFAGYDRQIVVARGEGMTLRVDGREVEMRARAPVVAFAGEAVTSCRLTAGPVLDLNVMVDRARARAWLEVRQLERQDRSVAAVGSDEVVLAIVLDGRLTTEPAGERHELGELDALRVDGPGPAFALEPIGGGATVALARITLVRSVS